VSLVALFAAMLLIQISMPAFNSITGKHFDLPITSLPAWGVLTVTLLTCFLVNGIYPALLLSSFKPLNVFKGKNILRINDAGFRRVLVVVQFGISVVLIIGTIVIYRQLNYMENKDLGYDRSHVFEMTIPWNVLGFDARKSVAMLNSVKNDLRQQGSITDVSNAGIESFFNNDNRSSGSFDWDGRPKDFNPSVATLSADGNFQRMMRLKMKDGHWFGSSGHDKHNVILNETAVKQLNLRLPVIGQRFKFQGDSGMVIGVVKDFNFRSLHEKIEPMVINNHIDRAGSFYLKTAPNSTAAAVSAANAVWNKFIASQPFEYNFLDEGYDKLYRAEQRSSVLITLFSAIAVLLSGMGLLGLVTFAAEQRVKEIGIRKILGASIQNIVALLSADFLKMVTIASLLAFPIAWWAMDKWLQDFAYRIPVSWWIFALAASVALIIALITISIQAIKAALANPVNSLRSE
jgi:putative ABC transport system permease protein